MSEVIGKVTATEKKPTTCNNVRFWVHKDAIIRPFDIVKIEHIPKVTGGQISNTYAIVQELQYITDSVSDLANYVSSDFGDLSSEPQNHRLGTTIAEAEVLHNDQEIEMPIHDGALVSWADSDGIREALGLKALTNPIPAGYIMMSNGEEIPVEFEANYLLGPEGAHLNISGISGLATKTSYAMFLMNSIQQKCADDVTMIIFNVKGTDLLSIDEAEELNDSEREEWQKCGLEAIPFKNVTYLYPFSGRQEHGFNLSNIDPVLLEKQQQEDKAFNYIYDIETGLSRIPLLFSDIDDPNSTMESILHQVPDIEAESWESFRQEVADRTQKGKGTGDISVLSWRKFNRLLETRTDHDLFTEKQCVGENKRQVLIRDAIKDFLAPGNVLVIDIEPLPPYLQCLVFGDVIQTVYGVKLTGEEDIDSTSLGTVIIFADELNKFAPRTGSGQTLTHFLLEITERGRSLGTILFGAEQFRSGVHDRVLGNCSTNVFGRTSPVEISKCPDYKYFPPTYQKQAIRLPQGHLLLQHAIFKTQLIKVRFPHPCYVQPKARR